MHAHRQFFLIALLAVALLAFGAATYVSGDLSPSKPHCSAGTVDKDGPGRPPACPGS